MKSVAFSIGFINIYWYSIFIFLGILAGSFVLYKRNKIVKIDEKKLTDIIFYIIIFGILGARIYYVLFNLDYYLKYPIEILEVYNGGLAIHGGIIGGFLAALYFSRKYKINILKLTDLITPSVLLAQAIGRWGNFFNSEAHGPVTTLEFLNKIHIPKFIINGMYINGSYYQPTFFYEFLWNLIGFIIIIILIKKIKLRTGQITGMYFSWYSLGRFFIESLRTDSLMLGSLKVAQLISILLFILGLILIFYKKNTRVYRNKERIEEYEN